MTGWIADTLLWTGILIAAVLLIRRPVARWFGPQMAYALWALPAARLLLPPIELPSWLAPATGLQGAAPMLDQNSALLVLNNETRFHTPVATTSGTAGSGAAGPDAATLITPVAGIDGSALIMAATAVWLIGAAAFLYLRFAAYFRLRAHLFDDAREVGRHGQIRFIETPATQSPLAFGVLNKVIALPCGFMAQGDKVARDLALAHELAHHRGRDLIVNMAIQPLFALHWFNPLGRYGWLALRRDQEAACDARVMAEAPAEAKAQYANVIASFAAGPNVALAAPMACPVLGEKSIIHRLRSLTMTDMSKRRKIAGRIMLGAAALGLPLTASISYAEVAAPKPPAAPLADAAVPAPPTPPAAPSVTAAPLAPAAPAAPLAPAAPSALQTATILTVDPDTGETRDISADKDENVTVIINRQDADERRVERSFYRSSAASNNRRLTREEREEVMQEVRESLSAAQAELDELPAQLAQSMAELNEADNRLERAVVKMECHSSSDDVATTMTDENGVTTTMICQKRVLANALVGLKEARKAIARSLEMDKSIRKDILKELDRQIKNWEEQTS